MRINETTTSWTGIGRNTIYKVMFTRSPLFHLFEKIIGICDVGLDLDRKVSPRSAVVSQETLCVGLF
jgi:hypothetical protein